MFGVTFIHILDTVAYVFGPMSRSYCTLANLIRNLVKTNGLLLYDALAITRYICIFWMKNPGAIDDDFWSIFISLWYVKPEIQVFCFALPAPGCTHRLDMLNL
jgi:hypothetical protein